MSMKIVDLSAEESPKSLLAFTTHVTSWRFKADCKAAGNAGSGPAGQANLTVSSLKVNEPSALFASCRVSSSSRQKVSHATCIRSY